MILDPDPKRVGYPKDKRKLKQRTRKWDEIEMERKWNEKEDKRNEMKDKWNGIQMKWNENENETQM